MSGFEFLHIFDTISDGEILLKISQKYQGDDELLPFYYYDICVGNTAVGKISVRIGKNYHSYYNGNIGYEIDMEYRGNKYAFKACKLMLQIAKAHSMNELILTCDESNVASYKDINDMIAENTRNIENDVVDIFALFDNDKLIGELHVKYENEDKDFAEKGKRAYLFAFRVHKD